MFFPIDRYTVKIIFVIIKTGRGLFPKKFLEDSLKGATGCVWIVLQSMYKVVPLVAL